MSDIGSDLVGTTPYPWQGAEWQSYCTELLYLHHGGRYQPIPDRDRGDGGLEGFSTDGQGCGYQCHAPGSHYGIAARRDHQARKIKSTVKRIIENRAGLGRLVGNHVILQVRFLFPLCESRQLVAVAREQEERLRAAANEHAITWLSADVVVSVHQGDELLAREMAELERVGAAHARLPSVRVDEADVDRQVEEAAWEAAVADKLRVRFGDANVAELLRVVLVDHLRGAALSACLERRNPQTYDDYARLIAERRTRIQRESLEGTTAQRTLTELGDELMNVITGSIAGLHAGDALHLAQGVIADWLLECPLSFTGTPAST